jgi:hypothetical protein
MGHWLAKSLLYLMRLTQRTFNKATKPPLDGSTSLIV